MDRGSGERQKKHLEEKTVARGIAYESSRSAAELGRLLHEKTRPWKWTMLWKERDAYFTKVTRPDRFRLYRVGRGPRFAWADVRVISARGGTTVLEVYPGVTDKIRLLAWALCVACFFLLLYVGTEQGAEAALQKWPYLALTALAAGMTAVSSGETRKVLEFLSQELDCRKSR